jgi:hypothetical protein
VSAALYGLLAEFETEQALLDAVHSARQAGFRKIDAYAPYAVEGLAEAIGFTHNRVPLAAMIGGIIGGAATYFLQWYAAVIDYPINVGGRPLHSWPSFIPATFEVTILGAALAAVCSMLWMNGLPTLRHPLFDAPLFDLATRNRFYLCLRANDAGFDIDRGHAFLQSLTPLAMCEVAR